MVMHAVFIARVVNLARHIHFRHKENKTRAMRLRVRMRDMNTWIDNINFLVVMISVRLAPINYGVVGLGQGEWPLFYGQRGHSPKVILWLSRNRGKLRLLRLY